MLSYIRTAAIIVHICIVIGCSVKEPRYPIGTKVRFDLPNEYFEGCRDIGIVEDVIYTITGDATYVIKPIRKAWQRVCPEAFYLLETSIRPYSSILKEDIEYE